MNNKKWIILDVIVSLVISIIFLSGLYVYYNYSVLKEAEESFYKPIELSKANVEDDNEADDRVNIRLPSPESGRNFNFMIIGNDARRGEFSRSDALLVGAYNFERNEALIFSIPRDTYVEIPGYGYDKINHAYAFGGASLLAETIEDYLGLPIEKYASLNFNGFIQLVDLVGGVPMNVEKDLIYHNHSNTSEYPINIKQGYQTLNGKDALGYARFRKDAEGDFGRNKRQQELIEGLTGQMINANLVGRIPDMIDILGYNLKTNFTIDEMTSYIIDITRKGNLSLEFDSLSGKGTKINGIYYYIIGESEIKRFREEIINFVD